MVVHQARAVIWDFDETIILSAHVFAQVLEEILPEFSLAMPSSRRIRENFHGPLWEAIQGCLGIELELAKQIETRFLEYENQGYGSHYQQVDDFVYKDALGLLKRTAAEGLPQVVVTNRYHEGFGAISPRVILGHKDLDGMITHIICGDDSPYRKPDARVLERLLQERTLLPEELVIVGDQFVDALLALELGAKGVLVSRFTPEPPHLERLEAKHPQWREHITIVPTLDEVAITMRQS